MNKYNLLIFLLTTFLLSLSSSVLTEECDSSCLTNLGNQYFDNFNGNSSSNLEINSETKFTINGEFQDINEGLWPTPVKLLYKEFFVDEKTKQVAGYSVIENIKGKALLAFRLEIEGKKIIEIEHLIANEGSHVLFAPEAIVESDRHYQDILPVNNRATRTQLIDLADAYFTGIEKTSSEGIPFHSDCNRIENGIATTNNPERGFSSTCAGGFSYFTYITEINNRRYPIVDTERGVIFSFVTFQIPGTANFAIRNGQRVELPERSRTPRTIYIAELFRVVDGQIRDIEAYMKNLPFGSTSGWPAE